MKSNRIFVNTIAFIEELQAGKSQSEFFRSVREAGFGAIEVRREFIRRFPEELVEMQSLANEIGLELYYSVPDWLYRDGVLQIEGLEQYIGEVQVLAAKMLKLSVGEFPGSIGDGLTLLRNAVNAFKGIVAVENDQSSQSGHLTVTLNFLRLCQESKINIYCTFDMGNWYWVQEEPVTNAIPLREFTRSIHLKNVVLEQDGPKVVGLDDGIIDWKRVLKSFPEDLPVGFEYPCGPRPMEVLRKDLAGLLTL